MTGCIYEKTDKGRDEIATRKYQVGPRLRTLLVMIDGRQRLDALLRDFSALGIDETCVRQLLEHEYIRPVAGNDNAALAEEPAALAARPFASARARKLERLRSSAQASRARDQDVSPGESLA
jgi:hypothetical protein